MLTEYFYKGLATKNSAESFTKFIRNLSLEGCEEDSRATFVKLVPYATPEQIDALVTGRSILSGKTANGHIDNPSIVDNMNHEEQLRFEADVNFVFRGLFKHSDGFYYRPYAYVSSYGIFDLFCKKPQMEMVMSIINKMDDYSEKSHKDMLSKQVEKRINLKKGLGLDKKTLVKRAKHYAFDENGNLLPVMKKILDVFKSENVLGIRRSTLSIASWFASSNSWLNSKTPLEMVASHGDEVLKAAKQEASPIMHG